MTNITDLKEQYEKLGEEIAKLEAEITKHDKKLSNKGFTDKAPAEVVATERQRRDEETATLAKVNEALERLKAL